MIRTLVQLGHDLGLRTIAEGVEEEAQLEYLRVNGIDQMQGFVFSRPLDPATFEASVLAPDTRAEAQPARSPSS